MKAEEIAEKARRSISKFCYEECRAYCCRKGYLVLTREEADLVAQGVQTKLEDKKIVKKMKGEDYYLNLSNGCPYLKDNLCIIHNNSKKPAVCKQFPIFIKDKNVKLSPVCLAVKMDIFYPYVHEFLKLGYNIS